MVGFFIPCTVTTTSQARMALKMLRENKDRFDLVISDVHMPDMDGFKLLELVGLEMDLPVIMLSANGDSKLHVIRRKKPNQTKSNDQGRARGEANWSPTSGNDESEDNGNDGEDPGTQKKPRVVWSIELHRKFVGAVNQLGIEMFSNSEAVSKRILDMMNVEGLTRENVASHLQACIRSFFTSRLILKCKNTLYALSN
ncbi:hypothetical protein RD792_007063 [Penstemon davidsonii]|uniref:Response regulatory domain-containing protein n=1 Tax=Penstemon davidsonii TaxID=160366 RepID=A0ABR0D630_9LAMI|nr:hypothetical protein RD792_007063 [Penstemon davidsonii]